MFYAACLYLDNVGVKGPRSRYNNKEAKPSIRRFVLEHIQNLNRVLADMEQAGLTINPSKTFQFSTSINIVSYVCDSAGCHPDTAKVIKITKQGPPINAAKARSFIRVVVYFRIQIPEFALLSCPIYVVAKLGSIFLQTLLKQHAIDQLKEALISALALVTIDYVDGGTIIIAVDASGLGQEVVLI